MQERNRESRKRNRKSRFDSRRTLEDKTSQSKPKELNPVEKRNQRIEQNKKKSRRADNRKVHHPSKKASSLNRDKESRVSKKKPKNSGKRASLKKATSKERKSHHPKTRKLSNLFTNKDFRRSEYVFFGLGLIFAYLFLLVSSVDTVISEGLFFIYLGVLLLRRPRIYSQGRFIDIIAIGIVLYSLGAFLPKFSYFFPEWRALAYDQYDISFGFLGTIMPLKSLEAFLMLVAAIVLYYHISCWKINNLGKEVLLILLIGVSFFAGCVQYFVGNYPLSFLLHENFAHSPIKDYSANLNLLYSVGGLGSLALFFDSFKSNKIVSVIGFIGVLLNLFFLIHGQSFFYYTLFFGLSFLLIVRLYLRGRPIIEKLLTLISIILCFTVFFYFNETWRSIWVDDLGGFFLSKGKEFWSLLLGSLKQLNFFGNGIATAHSILPQLSPLEYFKDDFSYRGSYLKAYMSDFGLVGLVAFILFGNYWISQHSSILNDSKKRHRFFYALIVIAFFVRFLMMSEGSSVGLLLILLMFLHLSLRLETNYLPIFSKKFCQLMGIFWLCLGMLWLSISITNVPLLSDVRYRLSYAYQFNEDVDFKALPIKNVEEKDRFISKGNPKKYFLKSYQLLESKSDKEAIVKTLHKTVFFEPNNPKIFLQNGYLLSDYAVKLAIDAWIAYFQYSPLKKLDDYLSLVYYSKDKSELLSHLERLSYLANEYAVELALVLNDLDFQKYIESHSLDRFFVSNRNSQFQFLKRLLEEGFFDKYSDYITEYGNDILNLAILEAIKQKELANFEQALLILRETILPEKIDIFEGDEDKKYIPRVFLKNYPDLEMGVVLMNSAIHEKNYEQALIYVDHILSMNNPPNYAYYWKAELLYRMKDYIDSWFAFVTYLEKANFQQFISKH